MNRNEPIAIVGMSCRLPGARSVEAFWSNLLAKVDGITPIPPQRKLLHDAAHRGPAGDRIPDWGGFIEDLETFDAPFFGFSGREAQVTDPQLRVMLHVVWEALEDAGIAPRQVAGHYVPVYVGSLGHDYFDMLVDDDKRFDIYAMVNNGLCNIAGRAAFFLGSHGPALGVDTACSSSLVAVDLACQSLWRGEARSAIAGGTNTMLINEASRAFARAGMIAKNGRCKAFDASGDGFIRSEGVAAVVLKRLSDAVADGDEVYALIRACSVTHDGGSGQYKTPNAVGQREMLRRAYAELDFAPTDVQFVECHGTGTRAGDPVEVDAIASVLCEGRAPGNPLWLGSVKTNIGHTEGTSGLAGMIKAALALKHRRLPANLHFRDPNPQIQWEKHQLRVPTELLEWPGDPQRPGRAGVNSFGLTGVNAHVVLEEYRGAARMTPVVVPPRATVWTVSGNSAQARHQNLERQLEAWDKHPEVSVESWLRSAAETRSALAHRVAILGQTRDELHAQARAFLKGERHAHVLVDDGGAARSADRVAFIFSGHGSQWHGMGRSLYRDEPAFRAAIDAVSAIVQRESGFSVVEQLHAAKEQWRLEELDVAQPVIYSVQTALAALWRHWGIEPAAVVGHSMGEAAAAHVAGILTLEDGAKIICRRSRLMQQLAGRGMMMVVEQSAAEAAELIRGHEHLVAVAVCNGPRSTVLSGDGKVIEKIAADLTARDVFCRTVRVGVASHSPQMDPLKDRLLEALADVKPRPGQVPLFSTVRERFGRRSEDWSAFTADYWWSNLRAPVMFGRALEDLIGRGIETFLEISPHPLQQQAVQQAPSATPRTLALPSCRRDEDERAVALKSLAELHVRGKNVAWDKIFAPAARVKLPLQAWQLERFDFDYTRYKQRSNAASAGGELHPWLAEPYAVPGREGELIFGVTASVEEAPVLKDHVVQGEVVFPGAGYLDLALAAGRHALGGGPVSLSEVAFERAWFPNPATGERIELVVSRESSVAGTFAFYRRAGSGPAERLVSGHLAVPPPAPAPLAVPGSGADPVLRGAAVYERLRESGLEYGEAFQGVEDVVAATPEGAVVRLRLTPQVMKSEGHALHPALLDAAFQASFAPRLATSDGPLATYLPVAAASVDVHGDWRAAAFAVIRVLEGGEQLAVDVAITDVSGRVLVETRGMRAAAISQSGAGEDAIVGWGHELGWKAQARVSGPSAPGRWLVLHGHHPRGAAIVEGLRAAGRSVAAVARSSRAADGYSFEALSSGGARARVRGDRADDLERLLADWKLQGDGPIEGLVYLWGLDERSTGNATPGGDEVAAVVARTQLPLLTLVQKTVGASSPGRLWVVTSGAMGEVGRAPSDVAVQSALWTVGRVIASEHPELACTRLELDPQVSSAEVLEELLAGDPEQEVRLSPTERQVSRLRRLELKPARAPYHPSSESSRAFSLERTPEGFARRPRHRPSGSHPALVEVRVRTALVHAGELQGAASGQVGTMAWRPWLGQVERAGAGFTAGQWVLGMSADSSLTSVVRAPSAQLHPMRDEAEGLAMLASARLYAASAYAVHKVARLHSGESLLLAGPATPEARALLEVARTVKLKVSWGVAAAEPGPPADWGAIPTLRLADVAPGGPRADAFITWGGPRAVAAGARWVAPFGTVLQLGEGTVSTPQGLPLLSNLIYGSVDFGEAWSERRDGMGEIYADALRRLRSGEWPVLTLPTVKLKNASVAGLAPGHVLVPIDDESLPQLEPRERFNPEGAYLITGGLGGLGLAVAEWMGRLGARNLFLAGRGEPTAEAVTHIETLRATGVQVETVKLDVSSEPQLLQFLRSLEQRRLRLRGVVHSAGLLADATLMTQTPEQFLKAFPPKVQGAWNLHRCTAGMDLDLFVVFSSAAAVLGSPGQANYVAANAFMDGLVRQRRLEGLAGASVQWGPWSEVGLAARPDRGGRLARQGLGSISPSQGVEALDRALGTQRGEVCVMPLDVSRWEASQLVSQGQHLFDELRSKGGAAAKAGGSAGAQLKADVLAAPDEAAAANRVRAFVRASAGAILGFPPDRLDVTRPLSGLGIDSLMAVELRKVLEAATRVQVPVASLLKGPSIDQLATDLAQKIRRGTPLSTENPKVRRATDRQLQALSAELPAQDLVLEPEVGARVDLLGAPSQPMREILVTGATGFLGVYLVAALAQSTSARLTCLVRGASVAAAMSRLRASLSAHGCWSEALSQRLRVVPGDLAAPRLGIDGDEYARLAREVDAIVHSGCDVNFVLGYSALRDANVGAVKQLIGLATEHKLKALHHVSTWAVFGALDYAKAAVREDAFPEKVPVGGYPQTKYVAELLLKQARERGVPVTVYRPTYVGWSSRTGAFNTREAFVRTLAVSLSLGLAPDVDATLPVTPVDHAAQLIAQLVVSPNARNRNFHITAPRLLKWTELVALVQKAGGAMKVVPYAEWRGAIAQVTQDAGLQAFLEELPSKPSPRGQSYLELMLTERMPNLQDRQNVSSVVDLASIPGAEVGVPSVKRLIERLTQKRLSR